MATKKVLAFGLLLLCSSLSCQTDPHVLIHQSETLVVSLQALPAGYPWLEPYRHPNHIPSKEIFGILESLNYDADSFVPFSRTHPRRVLTRHQVEWLAPELSKALSQSPPQKVAAFSIADEKRLDRWTKGFCFVLRDELHVIIEELRKPPYEGEQQPYQQRVSRWELLPGAQQRLYGTRLEEKATITNWIITPLREKVPSDE